MKILTNLCKFAILSVILGIVLIAVGVMKEIIALTIVGGCLIGGYVILASVTYVFAVFDSVKRKEEKAGGSKKLAEQETVEEINSTQGIKNESAVHERQAATAANAVRHMGASDRIIVILLILFIICGIAAVIVLISMGYKIVGVCTAVGVIAFVAILTVSANFYAKSRLKGEADPSVEPVEGKVLSCVMYTEISTTTGNNSAYYSNEKTRIISTIYKLRVLVRVEENGVLGGKSFREKRVTVYSDTPYDIGDSVELRLRKGSKRMYFIEK